MPSISNLLDEARDIETQKLQNIYGVSMKFVSLSSFVDFLAISATKMSK